MTVAQSLNDILFSNLPTKIKVKNKVYDINYDYKTIIKIITAFEDNTLYINEKYYIMLKLLYKKEIPNEDMEEAIEKGIKFIDLGKYFSDEEQASARVYSFTKDAQYIFTGINSTHKFDVIDNNIHWWKFMTLFMDMSGECFFSELIYYRKRKAEGKLTKEEKQQYKKIKDLVDLEQDEEMAKVRSEERKKFFDEFYS